jgi:deoxyadenosine/deoxycytidine kinase
MSNKLIAFVGIPGSGKTTAANIFKEDNRFLISEEDFGNNHFLDDYYKDMRRWAFHSQTYFLVNKVKQLKTLRDILAKHHVVQDFPLLQDISYAKTTYELNNMSDAEWDLYFQTYQILNQELIKPDIVVYLQVTPKTALERIRERGRDFESGIDENYLIALQKSVESLFQEISSSSTTITYNADKHDIANNTDHITKFREMICSHL